MFKTLEKKILQSSRRVRPAPPLSFETLLKAVSYGYGAGAVLRNKWYGTRKDGKGRYHRKSLPCPVISVGNIMAGGTGKTPMAVYLADLLIRMDKHPVVISRGYRGNLKKHAAVVSDGNQLFLDAARAGDEPCMMARLKRFPVVVGKDRYRAGCLALDRLPVDVVVLDDGFQHLRLHRDLDLVLMDHDFPVGNGRVLPAGLLREPAVPALARADAVILTRCPETVLRASHWVSGAAPELPVFYSRHQPLLVEVCPAGSSDSRPSRPGMNHSEPVLSLDQLQGVSVVLFSGIADNQAFFRTIRDLGANILDHLEFEDHNRYKRADFEKIQHHALALEADMLVTTEKDRVKMDPDITWPMDVAVVGVRLSLDNDAEFARLIDTRIQI
jgi:tetraacyldisaccharide 4'-kinase